MGDRILRDLPKQQWNNSFWHTVNMKRRSIRPVYSGWLNAMEMGKGCKDPSVWLFDILPLLGYNQSVKTSDDQTVAGTGWLRMKPWMGPGLIDGIDGKQPVVRWKAVDLEAEIIYNTELKQHAENFYFLSPWTHGERPMRHRFVELFCSWCSLNAVKMGSKELIKANN